MHKAQEHMNDNNQEGIFSVYKYIKLNFYLKDSFSIVENRL